MVMCCLMRCNLTCVARYQTRVAGERPGGHQRPEDSGREAGRLLCNNCGRRRLIDPYISLYLSLSRVAGVNEINNYKTNKQTLKLESNGGLVVHSRGGWWGLVVGVRGSDG